MSFEPGMEVAIVNDNFKFHLERVTIDKVYKTGNFILVGHEGEWRPSAIVSAAFPTSRAMWDRRRVELITPDLLKREEEQKLADRAYGAKARVSAIPSKLFTLESIVALERIADTLSPPKEKAE